MKLPLNSGASTDPLALQGQISPLEGAVWVGKESRATIVVDRGARNDGTDKNLASGPTDLLYGLTYGYS